MTGHEHLRDALGAYALDACPPPETRAVAEHLEGCRSCADEVGRLRRAAGWMGAQRPPAALRERVLAAALARRPERSTAAGALLDPYAGQVSALGGLLVRLTPWEWTAPVPRHGTVAGVVVHLAASDETVCADLGLWPAIDSAEPRRRWQAQAQHLLRRVSAGGVSMLDSPVRLAGAAAVRHPLRDALTQRVFETWTHADDIRRALDVPLEAPPPEQLRAIVELGVRLLPAAWLAAGLAPPGRAVRLVLTGTGGGEWLVHLPPAPAGEVGATVTAPLTEFCRLMANRHTPASLAHRTDGDPRLAADLLRVAATLGCD